MISPVQRWLGALAGLGGAILCWFLGSVLAPAVRTGQILQMGRTRYELIAFLFVPASVLAVLAFFWVPRQPDEGGSVRDGLRVRLLLALVFLVAFFLGFAR